MVIGTIQPDRNAGKINLNDHSIYAGTNSSDRKVFSFNRRQKRAEVRSSHHRKTGVVMNYSRLRSTPVGKVLRLVFCSLLLILFSVEKIRAQPGYVPSAEELEKKLEPDFKRLASQIANNPRDASPYMERANIYQRIYWTAQYHNSSTDIYSEKALADISTAIKLNPSGETYRARAEWHIIFWHQAGPSINEPVDIVKLFLKNADFDIARADLLSAIRLDKDNYRLSIYFSYLSDLHMMRASRLSEAVSELRARGKKYSVWDDFNIAIEYSKKMFELAPKKAGDFPTNYESRVATVYLNKGRAAYNLGEYDIAIDAFQSGEMYVTNNYLEICNYYRVWGNAYAKKNLHNQAVQAFTKALKASESYCRILFKLRGESYEAMGDLQKAAADYASEVAKDTFAGSTGELTIKQVKVYLKLGEADKALAELDQLIGRPGVTICPEVYRLRAETYRQLGRVDLALADEEKAGKMPQRPYCSDYKDLEKDF